jgi:hypothetical protein
VLDRVLDQRLEDHRRHHALRSTGANRFLEHQAGPKADLFDPDEMLHQVQFRFQRHLAVRVKAQGMAKELGKLQGHFPGAGRIERGQCADRVQAVEQEVGIDLGPQHAQLGVARHQLHFQFARFSQARTVEFDREVIRHR